MDEEKKEGEEMKIESRIVPSSFLDKDACRLGFQINVVGEWEEGAYGELSIAEPDGKTIAGAGKVVHSKEELKLFLEEVAASMYKQILKLIEEASL